MTALTPGILQAPRHDLPSLLRAVGRLAGTRALDASPAEREQTLEPVELLEESAVQVTGSGTACGFVDGVQSAIVLTYRARRPVYLVHTAAGAMDQACQPVAVRESVTIVASATDEDWVDSLATDIPVELLAAELPPDVERDAHRLLGSLRDSSERHLVQSLLDSGVATAHAPLVVDGSLRGRPGSTQLAGVVKTARTQYLPDERVLYGLRRGWRSPAFRIPSHGQPDRYSCYLRLHDSESSGWAFGLVRLETFDLAQLDPLAGLAMRCRQPLSSPDARADRHLAPVRAVEEFLRSRRPRLFDA